MEGIRGWPGLGRVGGREESKEGLCGSVCITGLELCARALEEIFPLNLLSPETEVDTKGNRANIGRIKIVQERDIREK